MRAPFWWVDQSEDCPFYGISSYTLLGSVARRETKSEKFKFQLRTLATRYCLWSASIAPELFLSLNKVWTMSYCSPLKISFGRWTFAPQLYKISSLFCFKFLELLGSRRKTMGVILNLLCLIILRNLLSNRFSPMTCIRTSETAVQKLSNILTQMVYLLAGVATGRWWWNFSSE